MELIPQRACFLQSYGVSVRFRVGEKIFLVYGVHREKRIVVKEYAKMRNYFISIPTIAAQKCIDILDGNFSRGFFKMSGDEIKIQRFHNFFGTASRISVTNERGYTNSIVIPGGEKGVGWTYLAKALGRVAEMMVTWRSFRDKALKKLTVPGVLYAEVVERRRYGKRVETEPQGMTRRPCTMTERNQKEEGQGSRLLIRPPGRDVETMEERHKMDSIKKPSQLGGGEGSKDDVQTGLAQYDSCIKETESFTNVDRTQKEKWPHVSRVTAVNKGKQDKPEKPKSEYQTVASHVRKQKKGCMIFGYWASAVFGPNLSDIYWACLWDWFTYEFT